MKILLTGASGFVGSHILDSLRARHLPTAILLRPTSNRSFLEPHLAGVEARSGSVGDPESLRRAMAGITHVVHCAGATKACRTSEFYAINQAGTRNIIDAANAQGGGWCEWSTSPVWPLRGRPCRKDRQARLTHPGLCPNTARASWPRNSR